MITTMNVSLPQAMKDWVEAQAQGGRYANSSDYVRDLIRRDQDRAAAVAAMQARVDEALADGPSPRNLAQIRAALRDGL